MPFTSNFLDLGAALGASSQPPVNFSKITNPAIFPSITGTLAPPEPPPRGPIGGFFDHIEKATQSPLFGLGVGLLSGSPQQGFQNARSLSRDQGSQQEKDEFLERIVELAASGAFTGKSRDQIAALIGQLAP